MIVSQETLNIWPAACVTLSHSIKDNDVWYLYLVYIRAPLARVSDSDSDSNDGRIHLVDCLWAVIHCCGDILHQNVMKLSLCQLDVPLLLPNPVDDSVTFLLWALQQLFWELKSHKHGGKEPRIVDYYLIVSFLRLGESQSSKSKIFNNVIGGDHAWIFFFNWDCNGAKN